MGRRAAHVCVQDEPWCQPDTRHQANVAAASAILLRIAARINARQAASRCCDDMASREQTPSTPNDEDDDH